MRLLLVLIVVVEAETRKGLTNYQQIRPTFSNNDDDDGDPSIDVYDKKSDLPVTFGHIFKEGHEDPMSDLKRPLDLLELHMRYPKNPEEAKLLLKNTDPKHVQWIIKPPAVVRSPRDEYLYNKDDKLPEDDSTGNQLKTRNDSAPLWFDLPAIQLRNIMAPTTPEIKKKVVANIQKDETEESKTQQKMDRYAGQAMNDQNSYSFFRRPHIRRGLSRKINWTTCEEFGRAAKFHPKDIVDLQWVPFFVWDRYPSVFVHTFSFPKNSEVKFYKNEYTPYLNITLDWNQPKLIMKTLRTEMLLIAADRKGLFDGVLRFDIPDYVKHNKVKLPMKKMRLKIVGKYLAMMHCNYNSAQILAVSGEEPPTPGKKLSEAKILNFRGRGGPVSRNFELEELAKAKQPQITEQKNLA